MNSYEFIIPTSQFPISRAFLLPLRRRRVERLEPPGNRLAGDGGIHLLVDLQDLAVRSDVERPAVRHLAEVEAAEVAEHAVLPGGLLGGIGQQGKVGALFLREGHVVLQGVDADHEVGDIERANHWATLTEGSAFGRSTSGERFGKPREDHRPAAQLRQRVGLAIGGLQREVGRALAG